jgi:hypothetical protein
VWNFRTLAVQRANGRTKYEYAILAGKLEEKIALERSTLKSLGCSVPLFHLDSITLMMPDKESDAKISKCIKLHLYRSYC